MGEVQEDTVRSTGVAGGGIDRRRVLAAGAAGVGLWAAPSIVTVPAASAGTPSPSGAILAVGAGGALAWRSLDDGVTWTVATTPINGHGRAVATDRLLS